MRKMTKAAVLAAMACVMAAALAGCGSKTDAAGSTAVGTETAADSAAQNSAADSSAAAGETQAQSAAADGKSYKIGVLQFIQHSALDKTNQGFVDAVNKSGLTVSWDQQNASGEQASCQTIAEKFVNDGDDLIFAIATPAAQAAAAATTEVPILFSAVTDPAASGLVADNKAPGGNLTGTSDLTPVAEQITLLKQLVPDAKTVGILYSTSESNSSIQAKLAQDACKAAGLEPVDYTVSTSNEIQTVVESMIGKVDALYIPTDNTIAAGMATVASVTTENKIPVICGEEGMVKEGGLATYGIDYYQLGYMAGEMAVDILKNGKQPKDMPVAYLPLEKCALTVNDEVAQSIDVDVSALKK